jgi:hypothetical protein
MTEQETKELSPRERSDRNLATRWKPGQSGNPAGRKKGQVGLSATLKLAMKSGGTNAAVYSALEILSDPNHRHFATIFKEVFDRVEGPVKQAIEHSIATQLMEGIELQGSSKGREPQGLPDGIGGVLSKEILGGDEGKKEASKDPTVDGGLV